MNDQVTKPARPLWLKILIGFGAFCLAIFIANYESCAPFFRSLPSDEEMIADFHAHRADFERLVKIYREDLSVPTCMRVLQPTPEIKAAMRRMHVVRVQGDGVMWLSPDPYSLDQDFQDKLTELLLKRWSSPELRKFEGVELNYSQKIVRSLAYWGEIEKRYYYIPLAPKVEKGQLKLPSGAPLGYDDGPLCRSLDSWTCPDDLGPFESAYRKIEDHWFIKMNQHKE